MIVIAWEYLTGRAVATDPIDRQSGEWPPHPDRVFQALVACWGERGEDAAELSALRWLESLGPPFLSAPDEHDTDGGTVHRNPVVKAYVPVNDIEGRRTGPYGDKQSGLLPDQRPRKERYFPSLHVGNATCALVWPESSLPDAYHKPMLRLCAGVTRIGHSSSLVRVWLDESPPQVRWEPVEAGRRGELSLRVFEAGRLDRLRAAHAAGQRPPTARWLGYRRIDATSAEPPRGSFDERLLVLRQVGGQRFTLNQTLSLTDALRKTLMPHAQGEILELISGHAADGSRSSHPHVAYLPLPFVEHPHSDGHLLGMALALPGGLDFDTEDAIYSTLLSAMDHKHLSLTLKLGKLGTTSLMVDDRHSQTKALRSHTWCRPAAQWASVSPIVLDRFPFKGCKDAEAWSALQVADACMRQGLPRPVEVEVMTVSRFTGAPAAREFNPVTDKSGCRRWHVHAVITFAAPVAGPLLLGAGRYRGYGLCRPLWERSAP